MSSAAKKPVVIPMAAVKSSQLQAIGYDAERQVLAVKFARGGAVYHYSGVKADLHAAFMAAESAGAFFTQRIKPLPCQKQDPAHEVKRLPADETEGHAHKAH